MPRSRSRRGRRHEVGRRHVDHHVDSGRRKKRRRVHGRDEEQVVEESDLTHRSGDRGTRRKRREGAAGEEPPSRTKRRRRQSVEAAPHSSNDATEAPTKDKTTSKRTTAKGGAVSKPKPHLEGQACEDSDASSEYSSSSSSSGQPMRIMWPMMPTMMAIPMAGAMFGYSPYALAAGYGYNSTYMGSHYMGNPSAQAKPNTGKDLEADTLDPPQENAGGEASTLSITNGAPEPFIPDPSTLVSHQPGGNVPEARVLASGDARVILQAPCSDAGADANGASGPASLSEKVHNQSDGTKPLVNTPSAAAGARPFNWRTTLCRHYARGTCHMGDQCNFSHHPDAPTEEERMVAQTARLTDASKAAKAYASALAINLQKGAETDNVDAQPAVAMSITAPRNAKTLPCRHFERGFCGNGDACTFAHGMQDLRKVAQPANAKTILCRHHDKGECRMGLNCSFAHGIEELRGATQQQPLRIGIQFPPSVNTLASSNAFDIAAS